MTLYTVVVCPECRYARVVPRQPQRTSCGRCQSSTKFSKLRHYYETEDKKAAADVRARVQARVNDLGDEFETALENDVILEEVEATISEHEYLSDKGADIEAIDAAGERAEQAQYRSKSKREIMKKAITDHGESRDSVLDYAGEHGLEREWANSYLNKGIANGGVTGGRNGPYRLL